MTDRAFRFGVLGVPQGDGEQWRSTARRAEELGGYSILLMPDSLQMLSPLPSLAVAASVTARLRVGTFVMASPLRHPRIAAWDAHSLSVLIDGRFELGIGTGIPQVVKQAVELLGVGDISGARRLRLVEETIDNLRELDGDRHTPVMMAAAGPKALALAAAKADIVTLAAGPLASRDEMRQMAAEVRAMAGDRAEKLELSMTIFGIGDQVPQWLEQFYGADAATLLEHDSLAMLRGDTRQMADELLRRRDEFGVSYIVVSSAFLEEMAPVVELLAGR